MSGRKRTQAPESVVPAMESPDGGELARILDTLADYLRDVHASWEYPDEPEALALWTLHAWFIREYRFTKEHTAYLEITSREPDCGKTELTEALRRVCPGGIRTGPTVAVITRFLMIPEARTLFIDQFHNLGRAKSVDKELLTQVLSLGHSPGGSIAVTGKDGNIETRDVYFPKAFIGLDKYRPDDEIRSRSIRFRFRQCTDAEQTELEQRQALRPLAETADRIARDIRAWVSEVSATALNTAMLDTRTRTLNDGTRLVARESDNFRMLFALADIAGDKYAKLIRDVAERMTSGSLSPDPDETEASRIDTEIIKLARTGRLPVENWHAPDKAPLPDVPGSGFVVRNTDLGWPRPRSRVSDGLPAVTLITNAKEQRAELRILPADLPQLLTALETTRRDLINAYDTAGRLHAQKDKNQRRDTVSKPFRSGEKARTIIAIDFTKTIFG